MKRAVSLLLSFAAAVSLAACGNFAASEKQEEIQDSADIRSEEAVETAGQSAASRDAEKAAEEQTAASRDEKKGTEEQTAASRDAMQKTEEQEAEMGTKTLVVYFSCTGTTKPLAEYAAEILGADLYEIAAEEPYTEADLAYYTGGRADKEQNDPDARPAISGSVENMDSYDTVVIGYPIWHGQAPRIISTFLESYDFSGKTIIPFCTSHSSGIGSSAADLQGLCSDSVKWMEGKRFEAGTSRDTIEEWLESMGIR